MEVLITALLVIYVSGFAVGVWGMFTMGELEPEPGDEPL